MGKRKRRKRQHPDNRKKVYAILVALVILLVFITLNDQLAPTGEVVHTATFSCDPADAGDFVLRYGCGNQEACSLAAIGALTLKPPCTAPLERAAFLEACDNAYKSLC